MGYIRERSLTDGSKRFYAEVQLKGGGPRLTATFNRKSDAKLWIQKTETEMRCGKNQLIAESRKYVFKDAVQRYSKEQTISVVKRGHLQWWDKELGHYFLKDIRPSLIAEKKQKLLTEPTEKGVVRSGSTCNRYLATLSHVLSICEKQWEWIESNPVKKISREKESRERIRFLSPEERQALLSACKESENPYLLTFVVLQLSTGCRYNEIRHLRWTDVDLNKGKITIRESKNGDVRSVPALGFALELLRQLASDQASLGYLFPSQEKSRPLDLRRAYRTAIRRANLRDFRGHDARHSYATEMLAQGLSLGEIGHLLGHRSVSMTRRYSHLIESRSVNAVAKMMEQAFEGAANGNGY